MFTLLDFLNLTNSLGDGAQTGTSGWSWEGK